jgi:hypothetical protein
MEDGRAAERPEILHAAALPSPRYTVVSSPLVTSLRSLDTSYNISQPPAHKKRRTYQYLHYIPPLFFCLSSTNIERIMLLQTVFPSYERSNSGFSSTEDGRCEVRAKIEGDTTEEGKGLMSANL